MDNLTLNGLLINVKNSTDRASFDNNTLTLPVYFSDWTYYQKADICLDESFVEVTIMGSIHRFETIYLVYDYGAWNRRTYKDMSVIKNLERVGAQKLKKADRHSVTMDFGRSKNGKQSLEVLSEKILSTFSVLTGSEELVRVRSWNQTKDVIFHQHTTKATLEAGQDVLEEFVTFLTNEGYPDQALSLQEQLLKALFEKIEINLDFKELFKKNRN